MKSLITFDCYGTLLDTAPLYQFIAHIARQGGLPPDAARAVFVNYEDRLMYGEPFLPYDQLICRILEYCDLELNADLFLRQYDEVLRIHRDMRPFPEVLPTLHCLKTMGCRLYLMSNSVHSVMDWHLEALDHLFDDVFLAEDTKCYKPDLSFFQKVGAALDLPAPHHLHAAAGYWWDIVPCSKMGWDKVWVNRNKRKGSARHRPYQEITSLDQLIPLLS